VVFQVLGICHSFILFKSCYHCNIRIHCSSTCILAVSEWWNAELECWMLWTIEYLTRIYGSHFHKMKNGRRDGYIRAAYCHSSRGMYFIQITDIRQAVGRFYRNVGGLYRINSEIIKKDHVESNIMMLSDYRWRDICDICHALCITHSLF